MDETEKENLEELTKLQLIDKILNQRINIKLLEAKNKRLEKELSIKDLALSEAKVSAKVRIYMEESLSLMEDIEILKNELREKKNKCKK